MKLLFLWVFAVLSTPLLAQSIEGAWQGTLIPPNQNREARVVIKISKSGSVYEGRLYYLEPGQQLNLGAVTLQGNAVKVAIPGIAASYEGKLDGEGNSISGAMIQGTNRLPLTLIRATPETAWELPPPVAAPRGLPEGAKLEYEVAVIKPAPDGPRGHGFNVTNTEFRARNTSLADLITFAFRLHRKQVAGLPDWAESERYDIQAKLSAQGEPTDVQLVTMLRNLIQSRFQLSFHTEKREVSVYAVGVGKDGVAGIKMVENDSSGFNVNAQGLGRVRFRGATMADFANTLQLRVLDRPVIDQSGLTGRFDFTLTWTPDEFQFPEATPAQRSTIATGPDAPPDLFTAVREQLGMKLEGTKAPSDVFVVDRVSRPSEN